jgi:hypothetical protein
MPLPVSARPETELLLLCASPVRTEARAARIRELLDASLDWLHLEALAESHGLLPLLCWEIKAVRPGIVPSSIEEKFQQNLRNSMLLTSALFRILDLFAENRIPAIPFKGPTLAVAAYGNLSLRTFADLDILIRPEDVWRARDLLFSDGYASNLKLASSRQSAYLHSYDELVLYGPSESPLVELHWAFVPRHFSVSLESPELWARAQALAIGSRTVPSLSPEDLFLVLSVHGAKHCWSHLGLVCDAARLISATDLPWPSLLARARRLGIHRMVLLACLLTNRLLDVALPEPVVLDLKSDPKQDTLARDIISAMFGVRHDETAILRSGLVHMRMRERRRDRLRYLFRLVTRPGIEDWQWVDLPSSLSALYPALRFPRLISKYWLRGR